MAVPRDVKIEAGDGASPASAPEADGLRRSSMPSTPLKMESPQEVHTPQLGPPYSHGNSQFSNQQAIPNYFSQYNMPSSSKDFFPLSTTLPAESQMFLGSALEPNDHFATIFMNGSEKSMMPNFGFNNGFSNMPMNKLNDGQQKYQYFEGLNPTPADGIAPSALDMRTSQNQPEFQFNPNVFPPQKKQTSGTGSAVGTPGLNGDKWDQWIEPDEWMDMPTASQ